MWCPSCGSSGAEGMKFCVNCGTQMSGFVDTMRPGPTGSSAQQATAVLSYSNGLAGVLVGRTIEKKYRLDSLLGTGGMGAVYEATRLHIGDTVAVKILHPDQGTDPHAAERFRREAQIAARLKHPNAVSIYDFGVSVDGLMYLVMELVEGFSLRKIIKQQGPLSIDAVAEVTAQVCAALDEAHGRNIIHRDIKPDNIIFNSTNSGLRVKVLDFGIAKLRDLAASNLTQTGSVMGTPHYMSPEQCMGEELDSRSDIYSLGVVLYEILCGVTPFHSPTPSAVVVQHVTQAPAPLRSLNISIPPAVEAVVLHALEKRREARPQTAAALAQEMRSAVYESSASRPTVPTGANNIPVTSSSRPVHNPGVIPTMVLSTPVSVRTATSEFSKPTAAASERKKLWPYILGALLLLVLGGVAVGAVGWMMWGSDTPQTTQNEQSRSSNKGQSRNQPSSQPSPPATADVSSADSAEKEFKALSGRYSSVTPTQRARLDADFKVAEEKYPTDYRFIYGRARLSATGPDSHGAFAILFQAARTALDNGQADAMLNELMRDKDSDFRKLSRGHDEWSDLTEALRLKNKDLLRHGPH